MPEYVCENESCKSKKFVQTQYVPISVVLDQDGEIHPSANKDAAKQLRFMARQENVLGYIDDWYDRFEVCCAKCGRVVRAGD